jgi:hypothetical protein
MLAQVSTRAGSSPRSSADWAERSMPAFRPAELPENRRESGGARRPNFFRSL